MYSEFHNSKIWKIMFTSRWFTSYFLGLTIKCLSMKKAFVKCFCFILSSSFVIRLQGAALDNSKAFLIRASEVANEVLGPSHHYVAAIVGQVISRWIMDIRHLSWTSYLMIVRVITPFWRIIDCKWLGMGKLFDASSEPYLLRRASH